MGGSQQWPHIVEGILALDVGLDYGPFQALNCSRRVLITGLPVLLQLQIWLSPLDGAR